MFCKKCGAQISEKSKFCPQCGTSLDETVTISRQENSRIKPEEKSKKKCLIPGVLLIVLTLAVCGVLLLYIKQNAQKKYHDKIDTAKTYFDAGEYHKAESAYEDAIEIEPKRTDGYVGLANSQIAQGDIEEAVATLQEGEESTGNQTFSKGAAGLQKIVLGESDPLMESELQVYFIVQDENGDIKVEQQSDTIQSSTDLIVDGITYPYLGNTTVQAQALKSNDESRYYIDGDVEEAYLSKYIYDFDQDGKDEMLAIILREDESMLSLIMFENKNGVWKISDSRDFDYYNYFRETVDVYRDADSIGIYDCYVDGVPADYKEVRIREVSYNEDAFSEEVEEYSADGFAWPSVGMPDFSPVNNEDNGLATEVKDLNLNFPISDQKNDCAPIARFIQGQVADTMDEMEWKWDGNSEPLRGIEIKYKDYANDQEEQPKAEKVDIKDYSDVLPEDMGGTLANDLALAMDIDVSSVYYDDSIRNWVVIDQVLSTGESDARDGYQVWLNGPADNFSMYGVNIGMSEADATSVLSSQGISLIAGGTDGCQDYQVDDNKSLSLAVEQGIVTKMRYNHFLGVGNR